MICIRIPMIEDDGGKDDQGSTQAVWFLLHAGLQNS